MPLYEHVFLARQDLGTSQVDAIAAQFSQIIEEQGGKVTKTEYWGLRTLTYRIRKNRKAHYVLLNVDAPAAAVQEVERNANLSEDIIRFLTVRVEALDAEPSAMMRRDRERAERSDRPERGFDRPGGDRGDRPARPERAGGERRPRF
ncbi:MAG: 30S ribosomal protein S6 [Sphingomonadales bacterium]|nr:MAG: 30S ribosomal protein S6 [Sphingomonadales bacterium]